MRRQTPGIKPAGLMGTVTAARCDHALGGVAAAKPGQPVTQDPSGAAALPTVEIIRGDKRATEVIK